MRDCEVDEVDWSDGPLDSQSPPSIEPKAPDVVEPKSPPTVVPFCDANANSKADGESNQQSPQFEDLSHEQLSLPFGETLPSGPAGAYSSSRFNISRAQRSRIGVRFNRREPTREDYANYVLYQANQKTYEAMFLKTFVNHALHPDQTGSIIPHNESYASVKRYLKKVSNNVNQIVTKMVWNAHSRTVNLLANDGKEGVYFWDHHKFDNKAFSDFSPDNTDSLVHQLQESWHRAWDPPQMVRYTTKDYPIGKHCSPFEEIDEVSETLFGDKSARLPTGRAVKPPSRKKKRCNLLRAATRPESEFAARGNWLHGFTDFSNVGPETQSLVFDNSGYASKASSIQGISVGIDMALSKEHEHHNPALHSHTHDETNPLCQHPNRLEVLVDHYGPGVPIQGLPASFAWRNRLIDDHRRRLADKRPHQQQRAQTSNQGIRTVIEQALARGVVEPPTAEVMAKIDVAARIEQRKRLRAAHSIQHPSKPYPEKLSKAKREKQPTNTKTDRVTQSAEPPRKKRKLAASCVSVVPEEPRLLPPHSSGSKTLEPHQTLPPSAYFDRHTEEEKPAWRCGIKHAMGYYYNAGNRKNCVGCFTSIDHNPKLRWMDFYLPSRSHFHQPAPGVLWNPSKQYAKSRRSTHLSHNSIAKEAFWDAINTGSSADVARQRAVEAVEQFLKPKTPPREPTPEIALNPAPVDIGPHPSGSKTMEHGQDIPECAYWEKKVNGEELAWRCDLNHAFGRYYLAGNKRTCPGCGSNVSGKAKHTELDFYLPDGVVIRQDAPDLVKWHPRKPYRMNGKPSKNRERQTLTHNQICSKKYWDAVEAGKEQVEALASALADTDVLLDARNEAIRTKHVELGAKHEALQKAALVSKSEVAKPSLLQNGQSGASITECVFVSVIPSKRGSNELCDGESEEVEEYESGQEALLAATETIYTTSSDDSTSSSDSE